MIETTITNIDGIESRYQIIHLPREEAWRVLGDGLDIRVPFTSVGFATPLTVVTRAYQLTLRKAVAS